MRKKNNCSSSFLRYVHQRQSDLQTHIENEPILTKI